MTDLIVRAYGSHDNALAAVAELKLYRFTDDEINVVSYLGGQRAGSNIASAELNEIIDAIAAGHVLKSEAAIYALSVTRGATLVTVRAPFGTGGRATAILDSYDPIETGVRPKEYPRPRQWNESTPASSFLHIGVLLDDTATLSAILGVPLLLERGRTALSVLHIPELLSAAASSATLFGIPAVFKRSPSISGLIGLPTLTGAKASLSSLLHIRLLLSDKASLSAFCDMAWLRPLATPLSSALHIPTLLKGTTSLSGIAGLPTLAGNTVVSSLVGLPTLAKSKFLRS
jgi:hypothetical protein